MKFFNYFGVLAFLWFATYVARTLHFFFFYRQLLQKIKTQRKYFESTNFKVAYQHHGKGKSLIFLHGIGANSYCWEKIVPELSDDYELWALDLPGFGLSSKNIFKSYDLQGQAERIIHFIEKNSIRKPTLVGNSMGGAIAMEIAHRRPDLIGEVVLINPAYDPNILWVRLPKWAAPLRVIIAFIMFPFSTQWGARWFINRLLYGQATSSEWHHVKNYFLPYQANLFAHITFAKAVDALVDPNFIYRIEKIKVPVLIVGAENDALVPLKFSKALKEKISGAKICIHSSGGHHLQEEDPKWLAQEIRTFINSTVS